MEQDTEATHSFIRAAPGRVFARLARVTLDGTLVRGMHVEFTPAQAMQMARHLDECARKAIAADGTGGQLSRLPFDEPSRARPG